MVFKYRAKLQNSDLLPKLYRDGFNDVSLFSIFSYICQLHMGGLSWLCETICSLFLGGLAQWEKQQIIVGPEKQQIIDLLDFSWILENPNRFQR